MCGARLRRGTPEVVGIDSGHGWHRISSSGDGTNPARDICGFPCERSFGGPPGRIAEGHLRCRSQFGSSRA